MEEQAVLWITPLFELSLQYKAEYKCLNKND